VELTKFYGIATSNKDSIKRSLQRLQSENLISHLHTWEYGFSYRFEDTFIPLSEIIKPEQYTFLDLRVMQKLSALGYKLYVLAYKFYDFTRGRGGETKYLEIEDFLTFFNQSYDKKSNIHEVKNRLLTQLRKEIEQFRSELKIDIDIFFKKFGRPITHIKLKFYKVPKLKEILSKFVDWKLIPKKLKRSYANRIKKQKEEDEFTRSRKKQEREHKENLNNARVFAKKRFLTDVFFPKIAKSTQKVFESTREWIKQNYPDYELNSLELANHHFNYFFKHDGFYKAFYEGVLTKDDFDIFKQNGSRIVARVKVQHPFLPSVQTELPIISMV
jgi:hypothetical protein